MGLNIIFSVRFYEFSKRTVFVAMYTCDLVEAMNILALDLHFLCLYVRTNLAAYVFHELK